MHLLTFLTVHKPSLLVRGLVLLAQGIMTNGLFLTYLVALKAAGGRGARWPAVGARARARAARTTEIGRCDGMAQRLRRMGNEPLSAGRQIGAVKSSFGPGLE